MLLDKAKHTVLKKEVRVIRFYPSDLASCPAPSESAFFKMVEQEAI